MKCEVICKTLDETRQLAEKFAILVAENDAQRGAQNGAKNGAFISLYGEIGAGKTAFVKLVADALGVKERVTSPSFVILNEYHSGKLPIYHFDLYRLENEGVKTILGELQEYSEGKILTFVEWAEFSQDEIPFNHMQINVTYEDDDARKYSFTAFGNSNLEIIKGLKQ